MCRQTKFLDYTVMDLAENGQVMISAQALSFYDLDEDTIRLAAREDGVQVRFTYDSNDNMIVTLRKIGLGH
jgi:hypothetical protein